MIDKERLYYLRSKESRRSIKIVLIPISSDSSDSLTSASRQGDRSEKDWDGWLVVSERKDKLEPF
jgi:hypothetical protein